MHLRRTVIALVAVPIGLLLAAPAGAALDFDRPLEISPADRLVYQDPQLAVGPGGATAAVWGRTTYGSDSDPFNHATVQFTRIHPDDSTDPLLSFDAGPAAAYYVDPDVAVDDDGRALVGFTDVGGTVRAVFVSADGVAGPVRTLDTSAGQIAHVQTAFTTDGTPLVAWSGSGGGEPRVVALSADGTPGPVHTVPGPVGRAYLDTSGPARLVWAQTNGSRRSHNEILSARLADDGSIGRPTEVLPAVRHGGKYDSVVVADGLVAAFRLEFGRERNPDAILVARTNGRGVPTTMAQAPARNPGGPRPWRFYAHLALATGTRNQAVAAWTQGRRGHPHKPGAVLRGVLLRGTHVRKPIAGGFAGHDVNTTAAAFAGRHAVVAGGNRTLRAVELKRSGRAGDIARLPGSRSKRNEDLELVAAGERLRAVWQQDDRGNGGRIVTSRGRLR
jgi:hypothetical protein